MKTDQNKCSVGKQETKQDGKPYEPVEFGKGITKSLTMLDTIGLVALIMLLQGLSHVMQIEYDNQKEKDDK